MNETITGVSKGKTATAKPVADPFGMPKYELPKMEVPAQFHATTDQGVAHARDACAKAQVASELPTPGAPNKYHRRRN